MLARLVDACAQPVLVDDASFDGNLDRAEERLGNRARRDVHRRVTRGGALERVANVGMAVLEDAREVGMTRPGQGHGLRALALGLALRRPRVHAPGPVLVVDVAHDERERRPQGAPVPKPGEHLDAVLLDLLPGRAAVTLLPPLEIGVDRVAVEHETCGQPGQDRDQGRPMRLSGSGEAKGHRERA